MAEFTSRSFYALVTSALTRLESDVDAAECHGVLCGMLCSPDGFDTAQWLQHLTNLDEQSALEPGHALGELIRFTVHGMDSDDYGFAILLPDDEESLLTRTDALGGWCRGFLAGFGVTRGAVSMSAESREFLGDLYKLSQVDPHTAVDDFGEQAFTEIVEYARMGAILLREENRAVTTGVFDYSNLH
ncbi:MAG: UPF0149 family protein [Gammaproteobacteria bacterium]|nr:UPF0149 family protein [Gammaproteobacteria bacterium]